MMRSRIGFRLLLSCSLLLALAFVEPRQRVAAAGDQGVPRQMAPGGPYLGMKAPGLAPELFAPGVVSTGLADRDVAMTPDGNEIYFSVTFRTIGTIMVTRRAGGRWTPPEVASFAAAAAYFHMEPCLSGDGRRVFFLTNRPRAGETPGPGWANQNIWAADRQGDGSWGEPYDLGAPINTEGAAFFPSVTRDGTLYFIRVKAPRKDAAVYRSPFVGGRFTEPERLSDVVNGTGATYNAFVAPDERYLIAAVEGRDDSTPPKKANYYVFFRNQDGTWSAGINLGPAINDPANTVHSPYVSPDGRHFFFSSNAPRERARPSLSGLTLARLVDLNASPQNGNADIYWVSAEVIEHLRPQARDALGRVPRHVM
jgi:hypothetical protein